MIIVELSSLVSILRHLQRRFYIEDTGTDIYSCVSETVQQKAH